MAHVGDHAAERAGHAGEARDQRAGEPDLADQRPDMERAAAAERHRREDFRVVAALDGHQPDRAGHVGIGDLDDRLGGRLDIEAEGRGDMLADGGGGGVRIEPVETPADRPVGVDPPERQIGVGHRRPVVAASVAGGAGIGARRFGADGEVAAAVDRRDRAAAGPDGGDLDHRRAHDQAEIDRRLQAIGALAPGDQGDVEAGAAHVAGDHVGEPRGLGDPRPRDDPRRRPRQRGANRERARRVDRHHPAIGLDDQQFGVDPLAREPGLDAFQIGAEDRLQADIEGRRRCALEFADLGQDQRRGVDMGVGPDRAHRLQRGALVGVVGIGVDEDDADRLAAALQ